MMMLSLPFKALLGLMSVLMLGCGLSPYLAVNTLNNAVVQQDQAQLQQVLDVKDLEAYAEVLVRGMLDIQLQKALQQQQQGARQAYKQQLAEVPARIKQLMGVQGLGYLLCGEVLANLNLPPSKPSGCWTVTGELQWEGLTKASVLLENPDTHWQSKLMLQRVGLFSWHAVAVDLPTERILERLLTQQQV